MCLASSPTETGNDARVVFGDNKRREARTRAFPRQIRQKALVEHMQRISRSSSQIDQPLIPAESGAGFANEVRAAKTTTNEETPQHGVDSTNEETPQHGVDSATAAHADDTALTAQWKGGRPTYRLVVPTGR